MSILSVSINHTCTRKYLRIRHYSKYPFCPNWKQTRLSFQHNKQEWHCGKVSCINNSSPYCILQPDCCKLLCIHSIVCSRGLIVGYEMHICIQVKLLTPLNWLGIQQFLPIFIILCNNKDSFYYVKHHQSVDLTLKPPRNQKSCLWPPSRFPSFPWFPSLQNSLQWCPLVFIPHQPSNLLNWTYYSLNWLALTLSPPPGPGLYVISQRIFRSQRKRQELEGCSYKAVVPGRICSCIRWKRVSAQSMSAAEPDHPEWDVWPSLFSGWWVLVPADSFGDLDRSLSLFDFSLSLLLWRQLKSVWKYFNGHLCAALYHISTGWGHSEIVLVLSNIK